MAVVKAGTELAAKSRITLEDLSGVSLFVPGQDSPYFKAIDGAFKAAGVEPNYAFFGRFEDCTGFLRNSTSAALFQFIKGDTHEMKGLTYIDVEPWIVFEYGLGYRDQLTPGEEAFVQHIREYARTQEQ